MSLQWTLVAAFLYSEIALVFLLVVPIASAKRWNQIFKSRFLQALSAQASWYFAFIIFVLILFLMDAVREMRKYSSSEVRAETHRVSDMQFETQTSMRLFRAQRNFYISGFALFLCLVIRRLVSLISREATLLAENEAALQQAKSATHTARTLLDQGAGEAAQNSSNEAHQKEIQSLNEQIKELNTELDKATKDKEAVLSQAKSLEKEYDRLSEEHRKLELKLNVQGEKKDD